MTTPDQYHGNVGRFLSGQDARTRTARYRAHQKEQVHGPDDFTRAEFFGSNHINKLLGHKDCVGIRMYYGKTHEDDQGNPTAEGVGRLISRLVIVGVRADGTDIFEDKTGQKDPGDGEALGDGHDCPRRCSMPPSSL